MSPKTLEILNKARSVIERHRLLLEAAIQIKNEGEALLDQMRATQQQPMVIRRPRLQNSRPRRHAPPCTQNATTGKPAVILPPKSTATPSTEH